MCQDPWQGWAFDGYSPLLQQARRFRGKQAVEKAVATQYEKCPSGYTRNIMESFLEEEAPKVRGVSQA